ncbi:PTS sugar transporter subunit IIA [Paenibacillus riograndensis]|uniref:PTS system glucose-specific transporter subunit IIA n=1 Tax=Paenibacillus riograndensis SBR5 TaxID=1073571 RepID=A0A0E4HDJ9_9BACL|nr:PTS glucose transporter subunit IIA [Paenibacillus riograndensis]CQR57362.1 PTS system glucose-specific transporter subunit IIA [Paenibacillus riograndensis SBR5]
MFGWRKNKIEENTLDIISPVPGQVVGLEQVPDEAFSTKAMGEGFAVQPIKGEVRAPFSGKISHIMNRSNHAILLENEAGIQILIHVGVDTVSLKGEGFVPHVVTGQTVEQGELLLEFDIARIQEAGLSDITSVIVPGGQEKVQRIEGLQDEDAVLRIYY